MPLEYFELTKVTVPDAKPNEFRLVTAAIIDCGLCGEMIDGMGGPGHGAICLRCAEVVMRGDARGAIKWSDKP